MALFRCLILVLVGVIASGCDGYSKEQRQEMQRIRDMVSANPGSVNSPDPQGYTPLHLAVLNNYTPLLKWLKDHGADPNALGQGGDRPLHVAIISDHNPDGALILNLLRLGADVNAANDYGDTPLHRAAYLGLTEKVQLLVKNKADVSRRTIRGETPLLYASRPEGYPETVLALIEGGAEVNAVDNFGIAPLHGAAMIGDIEVARVLVEKGADVNLQSLSGYTPLHVAALSGKAELVQFLLEKGANRDLQDHDKLTPAERATRFPARSYSSNESHAVDTSAAVMILKNYPLKHRQ